MGMGNPEWLGNQPVRSYKNFPSAIRIFRQQLEEILIGHIRTVIGHYRDKYPGVVRWWGDPSHRCKQAARSPTRGRRCTHGTELHFPAQQWWGQSQLASPLLHYF
jgi:hypothetical protein